MASQYHAPHPQHPPVLHKDIHIHNSHLGSKIKKEEKKKKKTMVDHIHSAIAQAKGHAANFKEQANQQIARSKAAFNKKKSEAAATIQGHTDAIKKRGANLRAKVGIGGRRRRRRRTRRRPRRHRRRHRRTRRRHRRTHRRHRRAHRRRRRTHRRRRR